MFGLSAGDLGAQQMAGPQIVAPQTPSDGQRPSAPWSPPAAAEEPLDAGAETLPAPADAEDQAESSDGDWLGDKEPLAGVASSWYQPSRWLGPSPWDTGLELGLNGSAGTNDSVSLRTGGYVKRKSRYSKIDFNLYYNRTATSGLITQNNANLYLRNDWLLDDNSPWTLFAKGNVFYDEFQTYDLQTNANTGIGYQFYDEEDIELTSRIGAGASREFGGQDEEVTPEALFGFEYEQRISATQKLSCKVDYYPQFEDFGRYRLVTDASWEIELDKPSNISLMLSASDRYDSTPDGGEPHLLNYSVLLLYKL